MAAKRPPLPGFDDLRPDQLVHVSDDQPGFTRRGAGRGYYYLDADGNKVDAPEHLERFRVLAVPPAYDEVWLAPSARGHLQATGRDAKGRKQYRYHPVWAELRNSSKFDQLPAFGQALPKLRRRLTRDIDRGDYGVEMMTAVAIRLMDLTGMRVGNEAYARENETYGVTTLQQRHVEVHGNQLQFEFSAKGGQAADVEISSRKLAQVLAKCEDLPGKALFTARSGDGTVTRIDSSQVNDYLREVTGQDNISAKTLRTWRGSVLCLEALMADSPAQAESERHSQTVEAVRQTALQLRNRPATCRKYYVHPAVLEAFEAADETAGNGQWPPEPDPDKPRELLQSESALLGLLARAD